MTTIAPVVFPIDVSLHNQGYQQQQLHKQCRICLEQSLPLIIACNCIGTVKYVHEQCLTKWAIEVFKKKLNEQQDQVDQYMIESIECQLCKQKIKLKVEWTDDRFTFQQARIINGECFWLIFGINVFITLICIACIFFTVIAFFMVLTENPASFNFSKFKTDPLSSWCSLLFTFGSGIIYLAKALKRLNGMFANRQFHIYGIIAKEKIQEPNASFQSNIGPKMNSMRPISDFRLNAEDYDSALNKGFNSKSKKAIPAFQIEPQTSQEIMIKSASIANFNHLVGLPPLTNIMSENT